MKPQVRLSGQKPEEEHNTVKAMSVMTIIFAVAGLAVAAEPSITPQPGCTCTGINKSTGKPWSASECQAACQLKQSVLGDVYNNLANPGLVSSFSLEKPEQNAQPAKSTNTEITRKQMLAGILLFVLVVGGSFGFLAWRMLGKNPYRRKKRAYKTDQEKLAVVANTASPPAVRSEPLPATTATAPALVTAPPGPKQSAGGVVLYSDELVEVAGNREQMENIIHWLEKPVSHELYPWTTWGQKLSAFTMGWRGFQPEMEVYAGGIEISIQEENRELWLQVITYAIREVFPVSLKLVVMENTPEGSVFALMPEESVQLALSGKCNLVTLTEGLRHHLLPTVHEHRRAAGH